MFASFTSFNIFNALIQLSYNTIKTSGTDILHIYIFYFYLSVCMYVWQVESWRTCSKFKKEIVL